MAVLQLHCTQTVRILGYLVLLTFVSAETYYITPTPNITCPNENVTCLSLTEYAQQSLETAPSSNITLTFAPGNYQLSSTLQVKNVATLVIRRLAEKNVSSLYIAMVTVTCNNSGFMFEGISELSISGLEFNGCINNTVRSVDQFRLEGCRFHTGHGIELERIKNAAIERSFFVSLIAKETDATYSLGTKRRRAGGAIVITNSTVVINECQFDGNTAEDGGSIYSENSDVEINMSNFTNNKADTDGGAIHADSSNITILNSMFINNTAKNGGVINAERFLYMGDVTIHDSTFISNTAKRSGGVIFSQNIIPVIIEHSTFSNNRAEITGGVFQASNGILTILESMFINNRADFAGVISIDTSIIYIHDSIFLKNTADIGAAIGAYKGAITIHKSNFTYNRASHDGGVIINYSFTLAESITINDSTFINNRGENNGGVIGVHNPYSIVDIHGSTFIDNTAGGDGGVIYAYYAKNITIQGSIFLNNRAKSGGAIDTQSSIKVTTYNCTFTNNIADDGGAIRAFGGCLSMIDCVFNNNTAQIQGAVIWVNSTTLISNGNLQITNNRTNTALEIIFALNSTLSLSGNAIVSNSYHGSLYPSISAVTFDGNTSLVNNIYDVKIIQKAGRLVTSLLQQLDKDISFNGSKEFPYNKLYKAPTCSDYRFVNTIYIYMFTDSTIYMPYSNTALFSGGECYFFLELNINAEVNLMAAVGSNVIATAQLHFSKISSEPAHLCFCRNGQPDCNYLSPTISVRKGETFNISLVVVDQNGNLIPHTVSAFLLSRDGRLGEGQAIQSTDFACKEFEYTIFSPRYSEQLALNVYGPCSNIEVSQTQIDVELLPCNCPVGFVVSSEQSNCVCDCDPDIYSEHITNCSYANESVQRRDNKWISYINTSDQEGYLIHPHCPFDYCRPSTEQVWINLNVPNGADAQCAFNRSGKLCGSCEEGLSLSLGSSHCKPCSNNWLALLIVFAIAGVALVAFLL